MVGAGKMNLVADLEDLGDPSDQLDGREAGDPSSHQGVSGEEKAFSVDPWLCWTFC